MSEAETRALNLVHPAEDMCIMADITAGGQFTLDCSAFWEAGAVVRLFNLAAGPSGALGYKFSASAVANINIGATSGASACNRIGVNQFDRAAIPRGQPYLHLQCPTATKVYISVASDTR